MEDARRDQVQDGLLSLDHEGVPGIVAALKADNRVGVFGVEIDDLPLAFIAPLGSDHNDVGHGASPLKRFGLTSCFNPVSFWSFLSIQSSTLVIQS